MAENNLSIEIDILDKSNSYVGLNKVFFSNSQRSNIKILQSMSWIKSFSMQLDTLIRRLSEKGKNVN